MSFPMNENDDHDDYTILRAPEPSPAPRGPDPALLAVDLGLRTGLAAYSRQGRLLWYRSHNFGSPERLRRGVASLLHEYGTLQQIVLEGGGNLALPWEREAERRRLGFRSIQAHDWRTLLLYDREQRKGKQAKGHADTLARRVIVWSQAPKPTSLRHDAAEAIMIGLWGVLELGWLPELPREIRRP